MNTTPKGYLLSWTVDDGEPGTLFVNITPKQALRTAKFMEDNDYQGAGVFPLDSMRLVEWDELVEDWFPGLEDEEDD